MTSPFATDPEVVLRLAAHAADAAESLADTATQLAHLDPGPRLFGVGAQGRLGDLGTELHAVLTSSLADRATEASAHGARYADLAVDLRAVLASYEQADRAAKDRLVPPTDGWQ